MTYQEAWFHTYSAAPRWWVSDVQQWQLKRLRKYLSKLS